MPESVEKGKRQQGRTSGSVAPATKQIWRRAACERIATLRELASAIESSSGTPDRELVEQALSHLDEATREITDRQGRRWLRKLNGASQEYVIGHSDAAEIMLLEAASQDRFEYLIPEVAHRVRSHLAPDDPRREAFYEMLHACSRQKLPIDREIAFRALRAANEERLHGYGSMRAMRNVLLVAVSLMTLLVCLVTLLGVLHPGALDLCFESGTHSVCPISDAPRAADVVLVELAGGVGAALLAALSLSKVRGTLVPFNLMIISAILKIPTGALFSVLGLTLMAGGFVPGFGALDHQSQIISWAVIFGCTQQLLTRGVDEQVQAFAQAVARPAASFRDAEEWSGLLDERLKEAGAEFSESVGDVVQEKIRRALRGQGFMELAGSIAAMVGASVQRSLRGPEIVAFTGSVQVTLQTPEGVFVEAESGGMALTPGNDYVLRVQLSAGAPEGGLGWEAMSIAGQPGDIARFALIPETEALVIQPSRREVEVQTSQGTVTSDFRVRSSSHRGEHPAWVAIYQHTRLVHVVRFRLTVNTEG